jgi:nicotinamidase-related amidase
MTTWEKYDVNIYVSPTESALLVVDVQVDFCSPTGMTARKHANSLMQALPVKIDEFVRYFQPLGGLLVYLKAVVDPTNRPENSRLLERIKNIKRPTEKNTVGAEFYGLDIPEAAVIIEKSYADAFARTSLKGVLESKGIKHVLVCGVRTEICVDMTARRACSEGYTVFVVRDLVATRDAATAHADHALMFIDAYYGFVVTTEKMEQLLTDGLTPAIL